MNIKSALVGLLGLAPVLVLGACTKEQQVLVKDGVTILDKACVFLTHITSDGTVQTICAYESELAPLVPLILTGRAKSATAPSASVSAAPPAAAPVSCQSACSAYCATKK